MEKRYLRIDDSGNVESVCEEVNMVGTESKVLAMLAEGSSRKMLNVFAVDGNQCSVVSTSEKCHVICTINHINLNTKFKLFDDGILRPVFSHSEGDQDYPSFTGRWSVPDNMILVLECRLTPAGKFHDKTGGMWKSHGNMVSHLMAFRPGIKNAWRLPTANVYEDGSICTGEFDGTANSIQASFEKAYRQFEKSDWNADLLDNKSAMGADSMFQFKLTKDSVEQVQPPEAWERHCSKIATPISNLVAEVIYG